MNDRSYLSKTAILAVIVMIFLLLWIERGMVGAQGFEVPHTEFSVACYDGTNIYWGYTSTGNMHFIGSGYDFVTKVGSYPKEFVSSELVDSLGFPTVIGLGYLEDNPAPGMENLPVFAAHISFDLATILPCAMVDSPTSTPEPVVTPDPLYVPTVTAEPYKPRTCVIQYPEIILVCSP